jgi:hypothetical protein
MLSVLAMFPAAADMMGRAITNSQVTEGLVNARGMQDGVDWTSFLDYSESVTAITLINSGSGYTSAPVVTISAPPVGGIQATANAFVSAGKVVGFIITNRGSGYIGPPILTISGGSGFAATAVATIGLVNVPIKNPNAIPAITTGWFNQPGSETPSFLLLDQFAVVGGVNRFSNLPIEVCAINNGNAAGLFFTCNSDLILNKSGIANLDDDGNSVSVEREAKFTISHFFTRPMPITYPKYIKRNILVFKDRSQVLTSNDFTYYTLNPSINTTTSTNQLTLSVNANGALKTRQWVMVTDSLANDYPTAVDFFEISTVDDSGATTTIEINPALPLGFGTGAKSVYLLKDVARVIYIGY